MSDFNRRHINFPDCNALGHISIWEMCQAIELRVLTEEDVEDVEEFLFAEVRHCHPDLFYSGKKNISKYKSIL